MRAVHKISIALMILLGSAHVAFTFRNYDEFTIDAFWFAAAGIAAFLPAGRNDAGGKAR